MWRKMIILCPVRTSAADDSIDAMSGKIYMMNNDYPPACI